MGVNEHEDWEVNLSDGIKVFKDKIFGIIICLFLRGVHILWSVCIIINGSDKPKDFKIPRNHDS